MEQHPSKRGHRHAISKRSYSPHLFLIFGIIRSKRFHSRERIDNLCAGACPTEHLIDEVVGGVCRSRRDMSDYRTLFPTSVYQASAAHDGNVGPQEIFITPTNEDFVKWRTVKDDLRH